MKLAFQLAYKNLIRAGLRTWLNVTVLSFVFVLIVFYNAFINGWQMQAELDGMAWEYGHGQLLNQNYDPDDPFTFQDGHGFLTKEEQEGLTPILVRQGTIYPDGRMLPIVIKGIDAHQHTMKIPTGLFNKGATEYPALIGTRMAESANLQQGDQVLLRWRDKNGTFDAASITIAGVFNTAVSTIDNGQIWLPLEKLRIMTGLHDQASFFLADKDYHPDELAGWKFVPLDELLKDLRAAVGMERATSMIIFMVLLSLCLLAIFDTQVLSIFRRQKEIGTYIALGMTRKEVLGIFTVEGSMYSAFAVVVGALYGIPVFVYTALVGIGMPKGMDQMGVAMSSRIFPVYTLLLVLGTILLMVSSATLVSYLPAKKIARMNPVNALKGKMI